MTKEQFKREMLYQMTLSIARTLLKDGLIFPDEFKKIDAFLKAKYNPVLGSLMADKP